MKINLASTRLAFFLIGLLLSLIVISAIIPQKELAENQIIDWHELLGDNYVIIEKLKLDQIYETPYFFIVIGLLALNLIFGNIKRFKIIYKTDKTLIKARHIGSIIFHLSLVLIMVGVILNYLYKFDGALALIEGQSVVDNEHIYSHIYKGPLFEDSYKRFEIKHVKFLTDYELNNTPTNACERSVKENQIAREQKKIITTNFPFSYLGLEFHFDQKFGYAPELVFIDSSNTAIFKSFIRIAIQEHPGQAKHLDYYIIPNTNHRVTIEVFPKNNSIDSTLYKLLVEKDDILLYEDTVRTGDTAYFQNYKVVIPRLRNWCYINVVKSPFLTLIFTSFWLALIGMTIGLIPRVIGTDKK